MICRNTMFLKSHFCQKSSKDKVEKKTKAQKSGYQFFFKFTADFAFSFFPILKTTMFVSTKTSEPYHGKSIFTVHVQVR